MPGDNVTITVTLIVPIAMDKVLALGEGTVQAFGAPDEVVVPDLIRRLLSFS